MYECRDHEFIAWEIPLNKKISIKFWDGFEEYGNGYDINLKLDQKENDDFLFFNSTDY